MSRLFDEDSYLSINNLSFDDFDNRSKRMITIITDKINNKYCKDYTASSATGIEHDGSAKWFYIAYPEENTETRDGLKHYLISEGDYYAPATDTWIEVESCEDYYRRVDEGQ